MRQKKKNPKRKPKGTIKHRSRLRNREKYCKAVLDSFLVNGMGIEKKKKVSAALPWPSPAPLNAPRSRCRSDRCVKRLALIPSLSMSSTASLTRRMTVTMEAGNNRERRSRVRSHSGMNHLRFHVTEKDTYTHVRRKDMLTLGPSNSPLDRCIWVCVCVSSLKAVNSLFHCISGNWTSGKTAWLLL